MILDKLPVTFGTNDGGADYDPHSWEDPAKPSLRERLTPDDPGHAALAGTGITLITGLALYLTQVFPAGPLALVTMAAALQFVMYHRGRKAAFERIRDLDWSILATGNTATVRYGEARSAGEAEVRADAHDEDGYQFQPARSVNVRGEKEFLEVRDVYGTQENIRAKMHRTGESGDVPARDYLPESWTATAETDTLGDVYVTFTGGLERSHRSPDIDRVATFPDVVPREIVGDIATEYEVMSEVQLPAATKKGEVQKRRADELARPVEEQIKERVGIALDIMQAQGVNRDEAVRRAMDENERPGSMPTDAVEEYDRDVSQSIDEELDR